MCHKLPECFVSKGNTNLNISFLQLANHTGYVQIDWKKVEKDVNKAKKHLKKRANKAAPEISTFIEEVKVAQLTSYTVTVKCRYILMLEQIH